MKQRARLASVALVVGFLLAHPAGADHDVCHTSEEDAPATSDVFRLLDDLADPGEDDGLLNLCEDPEPDTEPDPAPEPEPEPERTRAPNRTGGPALAPRTAETANAPLASSARRPRAPTGADTSAATLPPVVEAPAGSEDPMASAVIAGPAVAIFVAGLILAGLIGAAIGRRRASASAHRSRDLEVMAALDAVPEGILLTNADGTVRVANRAASALLGVRRDRLVGHPLWAHLGGSLDNGSWLPRWLRENGRRETSTTATLRHDRIPVALSVHIPAIDDAGPFVVLRDLRAERSVERMKREFLSNVGHELRTPLTSALGFARMLRTREMDPDRARAFVDQIVDACERLDRVIDLLIGVAAIDRGLTSERERVDLAAIAREAASAWGEHSTHRIDVHTTARLPAVVVDPTLVRHALNELLDNAIKFSPEGGQITLEATTEGRGGGRVVKLRVSDQGVGLDPSKLDELAADFIQADQSETRAFNGLGLGLAFVRRVAAIHGGRVEAHASPHGGTSIAIVLPAPSRARPAIDLDARARTLITVS